MRQGRFPRPWRPSNANDTDIGPWRRIMCLMVHRICHIHRSQGLQCSDPLSLPSCVAWLWWVEGDRMWSREDGANRERQLCSLAGLRQSLHWAAHSPSTSSHRLLLACFLLPSASVLDTPAFLLHEPLIPYGTLDNPCRCKNGRFHSKLCLTAHEADCF